MAQQFKTADPEEKLDLSALGINAPGAFPVWLRVTDEVGARSCASVTLNVSALCAADLGDTDGSAAITSLDASLILQYIVGLIPLDDPSQCRADVNENGAITAYDASFVLQCVVGLCGNLSGDFLASCSAHGHCP